MASTCQKLLLVVSQPALFRPLPSEPDVRVSRYPALQLLRASRFGSPHFASLALPLPYHLLPFPVSGALPRAVEYYGNSVALSLAAFRRSRICAHETFSTGRCLVRFLQPPHWWSLTVESVPPTATSQRYGGDAVSGMLRRAWAYTVGN